MYDKIKYMLKNKYDIKQIKERLDKINIQLTNHDKVKSCDISTRENYGETNVYHDDEVDLETDNVNMRGYRVKADGTKTTFFNNDMSDSVKTLIGDIKPRKIL